MQILRCVGAIVIQFRFFNRIKNIAILWKKAFWVCYTHNTSNYFKFLIGVNFDGGLHRDVSRCETESENWIFLKYGKIEKHPMQSLYVIVNTKNNVRSLRTSKSLGLTVFRRHYSQWEHYNHGGHWGHYSHKGHWGHNSHWRCCSYWGSWAH